MKRAAAFFSLLFFAALLWAQTQAGNADEEVFRHPLGPESMEAFLSACGRLAEHPVTKGNFDQEKTIRRLERSLKSSGSFIIASGFGMVWETLKPFPSTLTLGKDYVAQSRPGGQKTVLSAQGNETFIRLADVISAVFSGNARGLLDNFEVYFYMPAARGALWELGLSPLDSAISSFAERITMKGDFAIRSIFINERNGDTVSYTLSNHNFRTEPGDNEKTYFSFP